MASVNLFNTFNADLTRCSAQIRGQKKRCCKRLINQDDRQTRVQLLNILLHTGKAMGLESLPGLYFCKGYHRFDGIYHVENVAADEVLSQLRAMSTDQLQKHIDATPTKGTKSHRAAASQSVNPSEENTRLGSILNSSRTSTREGRLRGPDIHVITPPATATSPEPRRSARIQAQQRGIQPQVTAQTPKPFQQETAITPQNSRPHHNYPISPLVTARNNTAVQNNLNNSPEPRRSARIQARQEGIHSRAAAETVVSFQQQTGITPVLEHRSRSAEDNHPLPCFRIDKGNPDDGLCYVCHDHLKGSKSVLQCDTCRHRLHSTCGTTWLKFDPRCPVCKVDVLEEERSAIEAAACSDVSN